MRQKGELSEKLEMSQLAKPHKCVIVDFKQTPTKWQRKASFFY